MAEKSSTTEVSFTCQRCSMPLKLDESFRTVDARLCTEIAAPVVLLKRSTNNEQLIIPEAAAGDDTVCRKLTAPLRVVESENYTVVVGDNVHKEPGRFSQHLEMTARLFDVLTDQSEVEHPLCEECTDTLIDHMEKELSMAESEVSNSESTILEPFPISRLDELYSEFATFPDEMNSNSDSKSNLFHPCSPGERLQKIPE